MASRFYFQQDVAPAVSPPISGDWTHANTLWRVTATTKRAGALGGVLAYAPDGGDHLVDGTACIVSFVSDPLDAQSLPAQTVTLTIPATEVDAANNLFVTWKAYLVSADGTVADGTPVVALRRDTTEVATGTAATRTDSVTSTARTITAGQRLVFELGLGGLPTAAAGIQGHNGALTVLDAAASGDHAATDGVTTSLCPWLEFATTTLTFQAPDVPRAGTASFTRTSGVALTPGLPAGWAASDIHLLLVAVGSSVPTLATPSGWTLVREVVHATGDYIDAWLFWRRAQGGDVAPSLAFGDNAITIPRGARIYGMRGVPTTDVDPIDAWSWNVGEPTTTDLPFVDVTTGDRYVSALALAAWAENPLTVTTMSGWTQPGDGLATFGPSPVGDSTTAFVDDPRVVVDASTAPGVMLAHQYRTIVEPGVAGATAITTSDTGLAAAGWATFVVVFKTAYSATQIIGGIGGIGSGEAFGATTLAPGPVTIQGIGIASLQAFGQASVLRGTVAVLPSGIVSTEAFGATSIPSIISPVGLSTLEASGTPLVAPGAVMIAPAGLSTLEAFGTASLLVGVVSIQPSGLVTAEVFGALSLALGAVTVLPAGLASSEAFGSGSVSAGAVLLVPSGIGTAEQVGSPSLTAYSWILPEVILSEETFGAPSVTSLVVVSPLGIGSLETLGATVLTTLVTVLPASIVTAEAFGPVQLVPGGVTLALTGVASGEAFGLTLLQSGVSFIAATAIPPGEAFGGSLVIPGLVTLVPLGIGSGEAFGVPLLGSIISPVGLFSVEVFGGTALTIGAPIIGAVGIVPEEVFGDGVVTAGAAALLLEGIASDEVFGLPVFQYRQDILAEGLFSEESFGITLVVPDVSLILPPAIVTIEAFGLPLLVPGATPINVSGIDSAEAVGVPDVSAPLLLILLAIPSGEQVGGLTVLTPLLVKRVIRARAVDAAWGQTRIRSEAMGVSAATDRDYGRTKALDAPG